MPDSSPLPPVRLPSEAELARDALTAPLLSRAARLARWTGPRTRVDADGALVAEQLPAAAEALGLDADDTEPAGEAWRIALAAGLVEIADGEAGTVTAGPDLALLTGGSPRDVLGVWRGVLEAALADAAAPGDGPGGTGRNTAGARFLDDVLGSLYLLTAGGEDGPVPLPALAASVIVPDGAGRPTNDMLERVSEALVRLDGQFRALAPTGLVEYRPVDETLLVGDAPEEPPGPIDAADVVRYGMVRLTPLGRYGLRARLLAAGRDAPAVGDLAGKGADALLDGIAGFPPAAARAETEQWLALRQPLDAARELLAASRGADPGAPLRRLRCQQALALLGEAAEPALREVLDDAELGGLARVWLAERGAADVPPPSQDLVFWLTVDTVAAQLAAEDDSGELRFLVEALAERHDDFFTGAWRVDHPATAEVLEAMGRLHPDRKVAKEARRAAFKARSQQGG
jgi:hypothetical protein